MRKILLNASSKYLHFIKSKITVNTLVFLLDLIILKDSAHISIFFKSLRSYFFVTVINEFVLMHFLFYRSKIGR